MEYFLKSWVIVSTVVILDFVVFFCAHRESYHNIFNCVFALLSIFPLLLCLCDLLALLGTKKGATKVEVVNHLQQYLSAS